MEITALIKRKGKLNYHKILDISLITRSWSNQLRSNLEKQTSSVYFIFAHVQTAHVKLQG